MWAQNRTNGVLKSDKAEIVSGPMSDLDPYEPTKVLRPYGPKAVQGPCEARIKSTYSEKHKILSVSRKVKDMHFRQYSSLCTPIGQFFSSEQNLFIAFVLFRVHIVSFEDMAIDM